jgi:hypothetical protein
MAKVMVSFPDELLGAVDAEATRRGTSRSAVLQAGARRELGLLGDDCCETVAAYERFGHKWGGPVDAAALVRAERHRNDA